MSIEPLKTPDSALRAAINEFPADLAQGNRSAQMRRAYAADLARFASLGKVQTDLTVVCLSTVGTVKLGQACGKPCLTRDGEHVSVRGKGGRRQTILLHSHATELVNGSVSLATIRKRLGHKNPRTTLRYAEQSDATADTEVRAWRRSKRDT